MEKFRKSLNLKSRPSDLTVHSSDDHDADTLIDQDGIAPLPSSKKTSPSFHATHSQTFPPRIHSLNSPPPPPLPSPASPLNAVAGRDNPLPPLPHEATTTRQSILSTRSLGSPLRSNDSWRPPPTASSSSEDKHDMIDFVTTNGSAEPLDMLADLLFSEDHLQVILNDPTIFARFTVFLNHFRPHSIPVLVRYLEARKAIKAVEYANSLAEIIPAIPGDRTSMAPCAAASINSRFEQWCKNALEELASDILPAYVTYNLTKVVRDCLVKETTGTQTPLMRSLLDGLNEVFWVSDPNLEDNPIVYASEDFFRLTRYSREVIGSNCRFLQGNRTSHYSSNRLARAVQNGQEISETILTYRQDGSPYLSLLTLAPLVDDNAVVKYYLGTMVDVSGLIEHGRGLESFERTLINRQISEERQHKPSWTSQDTKSQENGISPSTETFGEPTMNKGLQTSAEEEQLHTNPITKLVQLAEMLSIEESTVVRSCIRKSSITQRSGIGSASIRSLPSRVPRQARRVLMDFPRSDSDDEAMPRNGGGATTSTGNRMSIAAAVSSDSLPAVYQHYLLIRPAPTLRVIFASPGIESPEGIVQTPFMSHVSGPKSTMDGLKDSFATGVPVTAKVTWHPLGKSEAILNRFDSQDYEAGRRSMSMDRSQEQRKVQKRWINATPLTGADGRIGVWMINLIEPTSSQRPSMSARNQAIASAKHSASGRNKRSSSRLSIHSTHSASTRRRIVPATPSIASNRLSVASHKTMPTMPFMPMSARTAEASIIADDGTEDHVMSDSQVRPHTGHGSRPGLLRKGFDSIIKEDSSMSWPLQVFVRADTPDSMLDKFPKPGGSNSGESNKENRYHGRRRGSSF